MMSYRRKLDGMRRAGRVAGQCLDYLAEHVRPGVRAIEIDRQAEEFIVRAGARPAFRGYRGYPASVCVSPNEVVIHGIPGDYVFVEGDIVGLDLGVELGGYYADVATTVAVGQASPERENLLRTTRLALDRAIGVVRPGVEIDRVGTVVSETVEEEGFQVVRSFCGHGIGRALHEPPEIPNYPSGNSFRLSPGLALAIEPMVNYLTCDVDVLSDGWTVVTRDGSPSAHFEETVFVLDDGCEVMTRR